uniref:UPF0158 family protein n=1 Tax=Flavobacterium sp. TaxID=239 RepID=UPI00404AB931
MDKTYSQILNEIAQDISCGNICYYNPKTNEIIAIPDISQGFNEGEAKEFFKEEIKKVKKQKKDLIKFEPLKSSKSFEIMERFAAQIDHKLFQSKLENILAQKKPFKQFKIEIDNSDYREDWFAFKQKAVEKIIEEQLKSSQD